MFCQLGNLQFIGGTSFTSFSAEEEAIIVEHELISQRSILEPTALGLRKLNIAVTFHAEYCNVRNSIAALKKYKNDFEILPLLWGMGELEGHFIISNIGSSKIQMDDIGNTICEAVSLSLIECSPDQLSENDRTRASKNAFAVGDKKTTEKSKRVNPSSCNSENAQLVSKIKSNGGMVDIVVAGYTNNPAANGKIITHITEIINNSDKLYKAAKNAGSCVAKISRIDVSIQAVKTSATKLKELVNSNIEKYPNLYFTPLNLSIKSENGSLQQSIRTLTTVSAPLLTGATLRK